MKQRNLFWKLFPSFLFISLISLLTIGIIAALSFRTFYYKETASDLRARAELVKITVRDLILSRHFPELQARVKRWGADSDMRFTVILPTGKVVADSDKDPQHMDNHQLRPEIEAALKGEGGTSVRYSHTLKKGSMYFALPVVAEGKTLAVVRAAVFVDSIQGALFQIYYKISLAYIGLALFIALVSWQRAKKISQPLEKIKQQALCIARGDFSTRISLNAGDPVEVEALAQSINEMSAQLSQRIETILSQKEEREALFSSMLEGVIAIDGEEKIIHINRAAMKILRLTHPSPEKVIGMSLQETIRIPDLEKFARQALRSRKPQEQEFCLYGTGQENRLKIVAGPLEGEKSGGLGAVFIINDVTGLRKLESHRKDFVANVSHELRTPLTSIQGYAETLLNPQVKDKAQRKEFLQVIHKHATRLGSIVEDLLALSRIEKEVEAEEIALEPHLLLPVIESAVRLCQERAELKNIPVKVDCPRDLTLATNRPLLEQAMVNLLDNAIKYSNSGEGQVEIQVLRVPGYVEIRFEDQGIGIADEHLPRLFERFYRVDKARSRQMGGTGLGLAIVKHIAHAHGGDVQVQSTYREGSCFSLRIPDSHLTEI